MVFSVTHGQTYQPWDRIVAHYIVAEFGGAARARPPVLASAARGKPAYLLLPYISAWVLGFGMATPPAGLHGRKKFSKVIYLLFLGHNAYQITGLTMILLEDHVLRRPEC